MKTSVSPRRPEQPEPVWRALPSSSPLTVRRAAATAVTPLIPSSSLRQHVVVGGQAAVDGTALTTVELVEHGRVYRLAPLSRGRMGCGVAVVVRRDDDDDDKKDNDEGTVYCVGGLASTTEGPPMVLNSIERLTGLSSSWEPVDETLTTPRWGAAVVTLDDKYIFVLGGRNADWKEVNSGEVGVRCNENSDTLEFSKMPYALKHKRFAAAAVALTQHSFLVMGGYDGKKWTDTCCIYDMSESPEDPKDGQWRAAASLSTAVRYPQAVRVRGGSGENNKDDDMVVVLGTKLDGTACLQVCQTQSETWAVVPPQAHAGLTGHETLWCTETQLMAAADDTMHVMDLQQHSLVATVSSSTVSVSSAASAPATTTTTAAVASDPDVLVVNDAVAVAVGSGHSQGSSKGGNGRGRGAVPTAQASSTTSLRIVQNRDCLVEGEMARYTGPMNEQGQRHGRGILIWADDQNRFWPKEMSKNTYYEGEFVSDSRVGVGTMFFDKEDRVYRGTFARGVLHGPDGTLFDGRRGLEYTGAFRKGTPHGEGQCTYNHTKQTFRGIWKHGKPFQGEWRDANGNILQAGTGPWNTDLAVD